MNSKKMGIGGKERHGAHAPGTHKSKGKKGKGHKPSMQEQHLQSLLLQSQSPVKKRNRGGGHNNYYNEQSFGHQNTKSDLMMAQPLVGLGQSGGGGHGRRKLVPEATMLSQAQLSTGTKASQQKLIAVQGSQGPGVKYVGANQGNTQRKAAMGQHGILTLPQGGQAYAYAAQIKEAAERGVAVGIHGRGGAKHHGHRKNQPVAIDTFNIVSNRRTSLIKQVNDASAQKVAHSHHNSGNPTFYKHTAQQKSTDNQSKQQHSTDLDQQAQVTSPGGQPVTTGTAAEQLTVGLSLQSSAGGLVLPDIISQSRSGMSHVTHATGHNPNLTPSQQTGVAQYQHRGSNSFSGVSGKHVLASAGGQEVIQNKVLSEKGEGQTRRVGGIHGHARTQQSADLQAQIQGKLYQPPAMAFSQVTNDYLSIAQSVDNKANGVSRSGGGSGARGVDVKRRTTGSLFHQANSQTVNSLAQSQLNCSNPQSKKQMALSPQGQSLGHAGKVNRRIQNIVSPIQDSTPNPVTRTVSNNLVIQSNDSPLAQQRVIKHEVENNITYPSALERNALHQSVGDNDRPRYPPLHSEQQSMIENSLFYDTKVYRMNPRSNCSGSRGHENPNSAAVSHQANFGESRNNGPEVTPREATTTEQALTAGQKKHNTIKTFATQEAKEGSAQQCRVDTDLSGQAYLAQSQDGDSTFDKNNNNNAIRHANGRHARRQEEARTQHGPEGPTPLRQMNQQIPDRVIHSNQDHSNLPQHLIHSEDDFNKRKGASFLQQHNSQVPSHESVTSDEDEDEDEEEDEVSIIKPSDQDMQMHDTVGQSDMYPQPQDVNEMNMTASGKPRKRHHGGEQPSHTQYGFGPHGGVHAQHMHNTAGSKEKRKGKRHRRQNTHHHYHIDFNFEQVNNILVSYGGLGLQQQLKHQGKKDNSKANVSMSMGVVHGQFSQNHKGGTSTSMPSHGAGIGPTGIGGGLNKRGQMQPNGILLPELIINKNKINFGSKQYRMHADEQRVSNRQLKEAAQNVASYNMAQQAAAASNRNVGAHGVQKTRRKKHKKDAHQQAIPFEEFQQTGTMARRNVADKYRTPKRPQMSQSLNPGLMSQQMQPYQSTEGRSINMGRLDAGIAAGRTPQDSIRVLRQSQVNMHAAPQHDTAVSPLDQVEVQNGQGYHGVLSRASNPSKESHGSGGEDSPGHQRERPTNQGLSDQKARRNSQVTSSAVRPGADMQWHSARKTREKASIDMQTGYDPKQVVMANHTATRTSGQLIGASGSKGATQATTPAAVPGKVGLVGQTSGPGAVALRARQKQPLHVITKAPGIHGQSGIIETPKRFFNVKAHNRGGSRARMGAFEHHSAGLRPGQRNAEPDEAPQTGTGQAAAGPRGTYNTLSQISSVLSASADKEGVRRGSATGSRPGGAGVGHTGAQPGSGQPYRGTSFLPPRTQKVKTILREQEKKLKAIDAQNRRTHQMLEQFNNSKGQASTFELQAEGNNANEGASSPMRPPEPKAAKPKITDFVLEGVAGIGNFGKVHKAYNKRAKRVCALKVLRKESVAQMKHVDHIINELEVLQYLADRDRQARLEWAPQPRDKDDDDDDEEVYVPECPFLMSMYSTFQDKENLYFELEYIEGCTLLSQIRLYNQNVQKNMTFYATEVLLALSYLHSRCIIYRDLKPENMVVSMTERGHIKLVDFGFAKMLKTVNQRTYTNCGTPAYIAPEILIDNKGHGHEVDIWSLGVLMYEIVSGQTPFHAETTLELYENINKCQPVYNKLINQALRDLLGKVFVKDPEVRITLEQMKLHRVFADQDWDIPVKTLYWCGSGPFIPKEAMFNEKADRESDKAEPAKPKNILAAIMGNPLADDKKDKAKAKDLKFDEMHYNKFEREEERARDYQDDSSPTKRKRQNPLGDFKFVKINELF